MYMYKSKQEITTLIVKNNWYGFKPSKLILHKLIHLKIIASVKNKMTRHIHNLMILYNQIIECA